MTTRLEVTGLSARAAGVTLRGVSFSWTNGVLAITGSPQDGTSLLLAILAGAAKRGSGRVLVHGRAPNDVRARLAHVPLDVVLPDALRVDEICELAAAVRGEPIKPARDRLALLGVESLAKREGRSLTRAEARAVTLALALTSSADVLLIDEPFAHLDPVAPSRVAEALRAKVSAGACAIVTTASVREATRIGDRVDVLTLGALAPMSPVIAHVSPSHGAIMRVVVGNREASSELVAVLTRDPAVTSVDVGAYAKSPSMIVVVSGAELVALATAITRAVAQVGTPVETIETLVMPLDAIRATLSAPRPIPPAPPPPPPPPAPPVEIAP